ncbi:hypothetical protein NVP2275O_162 [Vibrio phage 2.275.O._10N.286.54.E11]|nr:hypothetical protein NVP2275O_162 [Vibrio phage 2.275.O._10N.286.54.E11]
MREEQIIDELNYLVPKIDGSSDWPSRNGNLGEYQLVQAILEGNWGKFWSIDARDQRACCNYNSTLFQKERRADKKARLNDRK